MAIDWSDVGIGVVGEELVSLVISSTLFFEVALAELPTLDQLAFEQYVAGLQEAGWQGPPQLARLGYAVAAVLYSGLGALQFMPFWVDEGQHDFLEQTFGQPIEVIADQHAMIGRFLLGLAEEARQLRRELGLIEDRSG